MAPPFVHLSVRSVYSLREGAIRLDELAARTRALGMHAVALTDRDSLAGAVRFTKACKAYGIRPIYGVRLTVGEPASERFVLTLLARDARGYENLCRLVSAAHHNGERGDPCATVADVLAHSDGVFCLLGPESDVGRFVQARKMDAAHAALRRWLEGFGYRRTVLEVRSWLEEGDRGRVARALALADELKLRAVATNGARALTQADGFLCDVLDAMRKLVPLAEHHRDNRNHEATFKSPEEMGALFGWRPQLLVESYRIAEECTFTLTLGEIQVPQYPVPNGLPRRSLNELLAMCCYEGIDRRGMRRTQKVQRLLDAELQMCARLGFAGYFLTVADIVQRIKARGIRSACRGSAAGSLICYLTQISEVDPVEHDLVFERFMNPYRTHELPDIDLDVESARREEVYADILDHFQTERVACVAMVDTYRARGAIREVGKALGLPDGEVDLVAKSFPHINASGIRAALDHLPELKRSSLRKGQMEMLFGIAERLDGFPRHLALHPSGILIAPDDLLTRTPMERSANNFRMSQFDKDDIEALGLLKLDVIGIRMLSSMTHAAAEVKRVTGEEIDLDQIPRDDPATFELMRSSRTLGCFQIESPGQRELLGKLQPQKWKDLIVEISLFRPGPVRSDMIGPYLSRRGAWARAVYAHPVMREFLGDTFGVIVYHEQVMRAISAVTGVDLGKADEVRRALEDSDALDDIRRWFFEMGRRNQWRDAEIEPVWHEVSSFAAFGFCNAHAAAFAVPTYQSAWLKANHPAAFYAGILTHEPGMYPRRALLDDARHEGIPILPLDVNASDTRYTIERHANIAAVRIGLMHVEGISDAEIDSILIARQQKRFTGLVDFCRRTRVSRPVVEGLIHAGAFDAFGGRRDMLLLVKELWDKKEPKPEPTQQELTVQEPVTSWGLRAYSDAEKVRAEIEVTGMDVSRHIVSFYGDVLGTLGVTRADRLRGKRQDARIMIAGVKVASQTPAVRSGQRIIFVTLDDGTGLSDATVFESVQEHCAWTVFHSWLLVIRGTLRKTGSGRGGVSINCERAWDLGELAKQHREGTLDVDALWTEGVAEIEAAEAERRRDRGKPDPAPVHDHPARAIPIPARELARPAASAPRKLWHASGGSAGA
ncbi:MAG: DNA polymerase III subunit alpha [Actinomycetota bacterium]